MKRRWPWAAALLIFAAPSAFATQAPAPADTTGDTTGARPVAPPAAAAPAKRPAPAGKTPTWILPAGQEKAVSALFAVPGFPEALAIEIDLARVKATYADGRVLYAEHPSTHDGSAAVVKTAHVLVRRGAGLWTPDALAKVAAHVKAAKPPTWRKPAGRTPKPQIAQPDAAHAARLEDLMSQASEALSIDEKDKALKLLRQVVRDGRFDTMRKVRLGGLLRRAGDERGGLKLLREATASLAARAKSKPDVRPLWADALARLDAAAAAKVATQAVTADKTRDRCVWAMVAYTLNEAGERDAAVRIADAVLKAEPKCERAWLVKGLAADHGKDAWRRVLAVTDAALAQLPDSLPLLNLKAGAHHAGWQNREAAATWEKIARKDLKFPGVMGMLATAWTQLPELHDADFLDPMLARLKTDPDDVISRYIVGTASYYRGDFEAVIRYLDPLREVVPREPRVHLYTAMSHFHLGHTDIAERRLASLEKFGHSDPDYYYCRSVMRRHTDFEGSLRDLETFVRLSEHRQNSPEKVFKMHRELEVMRSGRVPNAFDLLPDWLRWSILAGLAAFLLLLAAMLIRKRRG